MKRWEEFTKQLEATTTNIKFCQAEKTRLEDKGFEVRFICQFGLCWLEVYR